MDGRPGRSGRRASGWGTATADAGLIGVVVAPRWVGRVGGQADGEYSPRNGVACGWREKE